METMAKDKTLRFSFGENWHSYVNNIFNEEKLHLAKNSLKQLLQVENLKNKTFLDIGCGSGLFSLAACELDAECVMSFDLDEVSVKASQVLRDKQPQHSDKWIILQGSVLDEQFMRSVEPTDIVYSWGVLHHTGAMWQAIDNAISKIRPGGLLAIAIYNNVDRYFGGSDTWWHIKRIYNSAPKFIKNLMICVYVCNFGFRQLVTFRNPLKTINNWSVSNKDKPRAMDFWHDVRDWLGGFPYEYATAGEVFNYIHKKHHLQLEYLTTTYSLGNNQFVFRKNQ